MSFVQPIKSRRELVLKRVFSRIPSRESSEPAIFLWRHLYIMEWSLAIMSSFEACADSRTVHPGPEKLWLRVPRMI